MPEANKANEALIANVCVSTDHYIGDQHMPFVQRFDDISPIDGTVIAQVAHGGAAEVNAAVAAAKAAFPAWAAPGPHGRLPYLEKLTHIIEERVSDLADVETTYNCSLREANHVAAQISVGFTFDATPDWLSS